MILLNTFSDVFLSSELDWLQQKVILAPVNSQRLLWRYPYELFPKPINYLFRCVFHFWIGLTLAKSYPCICQFSAHVAMNTLNISIIYVPFPSRMPFSLTGQMFLKIVSFFSTPFYTPLFWLKKFLLLSFDFSCTYNLPLTLILFLPFSIPQNRKPKFLHQIQSIMYSFHNTVYTSPDIR